MRYYSTNLDRTFKTESGALKSVKKYRKMIFEELEDVEKSILNGWKLYLGEPIKKRKNELKLGLLDIDYEIKFLQNLIMHNKNKRK